MGCFALRSHGGGGEPKSSFAYLRRKLSSPERVIVVANGSSNGIDVEYFHPQDYEYRRDLRAALDFSETDKVIGFVGRIAGDKGVGDLLPLLEIVGEKVPEARLVIAGFIDDSVRQPGNGQSDAASTCSVAGPSCGSQRALLDR